MAISEMGSRNVNDVHRGRPAARRIVQLTLRRKLTITCGRSDGAEGYLDQSLLISLHFCLYCFWRLISKRTFAFSTRSGGMFFKVRLYTWCVCFIYSYCHRFMLLYSVIFFISYSLLQSIVFTLTFLWSFQLIWRYIFLTSITTEVKFRQFINLKK